MEDNSNRSVLPIPLFPVLVIVAGLAGAVFYFLRNNGLDSSAALYVGIPILLAIALSFTNKAQTIIGGTMKGMTIFLLLIAPLLGEGYICILMAAPIFYLIAFAAALLIQYLKNKKDQSHNSHILLGLIMLSALEGTSPELSFNRQHEVSVTQTLEIPAEEIKNRLAAPLDLEATRPLFLQIFPLPEKAVNEGISVGDKLTMDFTYKKLFIWKPQKGQLELQVDKVDDRSLRYIPVKDDSYISNYMTWKSSLIEWQAIDAEHTKVTWTLAYQRDLDPAWYFGPLQYLATKLTAKSLIDNILVE